jgi:hypothetical protein
MPVRDGARWLGEAITSIQDQTLSDFELIIIDDGSVGPIEDPAFSHALPKPVPTARRRVGYSSAE